MTYDSLQGVNNTVTNKYVTNHQLNFSVNLYEPQVPGSVKHSSKPSSTTASSIMKNQISQAMGSLKAKNSGFKAKYKKDTPNNFVSSSKVKYETNRPNLANYKSKGGLNGNSIDTVQSVNSSIYASRISKGMSDLNKSAESSKKSSCKPKYSQHSSQKNEISIVVNKASQKTDNSQILELKPGYNPTNDDNFGLDDKYLESSLDRSGPNGLGTQLWGQEQHAQFENMASDSMTSLGSVPDEYTVINDDKAKQNKPEVVKVDKNELSQPNNSNLPEKLDESDQLEIDKKEFVQSEDTEDLGNANTQSTGIELNYNLNIQSMISHLKRKDEYMETLDGFLDENLKAIADLINTKKNCKSELASILGEIEADKSEIESQETQTKNLERDIARTLEENYCLRFQNDETIKTIQRIREKTAEKYSERTSELEQLYDYKEQLKDRVEGDIKSDSDMVTRRAKYGSALGEAQIANITNKLTSMDYRIDCIRKIVHNERDRASQRLQNVRDKTEILNRLIKDEDFEDVSTENSVIRRGIWNLLNN